MNAEVHIPQGEETVTVELTVKQAMALSGIRFHKEPTLLSEARRQLKRKLDSTLLPGKDQVHFEDLKL